MRSPSLNLWAMFWIHCFVASKILAKPHWKLLLQIHAQILFNMIVNFERIFFQAALVDWFLRMLKKQVCLLSLYGATFLIPEWSIYMEDIVLAVAGTGCKTSWLHINVRSNLSRNYCSLLISFILSTHLLSRPWSNTPLDHRKP